jgi:hypothetical protein
MSTNEEQNQKQNQKQNPKKRNNPFQYIHIIITIDHPSKEGGFILGNYIPVVQKQTN